jgi:hypothetical protein
MYEKANRRGWSYRGIVRGRGRCTNGGRDGGAERKSDVKIQMEVSVEAVVYHVTVSLSWIEAHTHESETVRCYLTYTRHSRIHWERRNRVKEEEEEEKEGFEN